VRKLAVVASHPIQYQAPLFRALADVCDLTVFFCHRQSARAQGDAGFGRAFDWDIPLLDGYRYEWSENVSRHPGVSSFFGCDTPGIGERLARGGFDACLVNGWYLKSYLQAIRAGRALGLRVLLRGDSHLGRHRPAFVRAAKYLPYRWMLGRVDAHLYVGRANWEYLRHYGVPEARLHFAPHFVENERFARGAAVARQSGDARALRSAWGSGDDDVVFGFVGKLIPPKRAEDLVEAIAIARTQEPGIRGVIVGSGSEEGRLRARATAAAAPIAFAGFKNQSELPACYGAIDALVLPSAEESWGLVINEAMAAGVPAIASDAVGAAADLIEDDATGYVYAAGDVPGLTSRIVQLARRLRNDRAVITEAVLRRISGYSCASAVAGVLAGIESGSAEEALYPSGGESRA